MSDYLSSPALLALLERAPDPVSVASLLNSAPAGAFAPTEQGIKGFLLGMSKTRQDNQAQVLQAVMSRGPGLLQALDVSRHLFLAQQVGRQGSRQGAKLLRQSWSEVNLSEPTQVGLMGWVGRHALLNRQEGVWQEVATWPSQADRPDRLLLAFQWARTPEEFAWGWQFQPTTSWKVCVETAWGVLQRGWPPRPNPWTVHSPAVAVEVAQRLVDPLPWEEAGLPNALSSLFGLPTSPLRALLENEFRLDPRVRLEALEACLPLLRQWETRQVTLTYGSQALERAHQRHVQRLGQAIG